MDDLQHDGEGAVGSDDSMTINNSQSLSLSQSEEQQPQDSMSISFVKVALSDIDLPAYQRLNYSMSAVSLGSKKNRDGELDLINGEAVEVISTRGWALVRKKDGKEGFVRFDELEFPLESIRRQPYWFEGDIEDATRALMTPGVEVGTFLLRPARKNRLALSIRDFDTHGPVVLHIRVLKTSEGRYCLDGLVNETFGDVESLIDNYYTDGKKVMPGLFLFCPYSPHHPAPNDQQLEIKQSDLKRLKVIDQGCFGQLWSATYGTPEVEVLAKTSEQIYNEAALMQTAWHPKIARLLGVSSDGPVPMLVYSKLPCGFLLDYLLSHAQQQDLCLSSLLKVAAETCEAMQFLSDRRIVHRDLRAQNVTLGHRHEVQIGEFSLAVQTADGSPFFERQDVLVALRWTAPESLFHRCFSTQSDVWSFGCLLHEMITYGRPPLENMKCEQVIEFLARATPLPNPATIDRASVSVLCSDAVYYQLMLPCWSHQPAIRPSFAYLRQTALSLRDQLLNKQPDEK